MLKDKTNFMVFYYILIVNVLKNFLILIQLEITKLIYIRI